MSKFAASLVNTCLRIRPEDNVTLFFYPHSLAIAEDLADECFKVGADVLLNLYTDRYYESYMRRLSVESLRQPSAFCHGLTAMSTVEFFLGGPYDPALFRRIAPEKMAAADEGETAAHFPLAKERKVRSLFVALGQVTRPRAKAYGFSYPAWERMMRAASAVSFERLAADGRRVAAVLERGDHVRITAKNGTDLEFSIRGRPAFVYDGVVDEDDFAREAYGDSIPGGAVHVSPLETTANGTVTFDAPQAWAGRTVRRLSWTFQDGRVSSFTGDAVANRLRADMERHSGDKDRIATLAIGLNPRAQYGFLQNGIVRGAVTLGIGNNEMEAGANRGGYGYAQTIRSATLEVDGKVVVRGGKLLG